jgi:hypothetical protein
MAPIIWSMINPIQPSVSVRHIYLLTSRYHMRRASWLANIILRWGYGIAYTSLPIPDPCTIEALSKPDKGVAMNSNNMVNKQLQLETFTRCLRDSIRALLWLYLGIDGTCVSRCVHPRRWARSDASKPHSS